MYKLLFLFSIVVSACNAQTVETALPVQQEKEKQLLEQQPLCQKNRYAIVRILGMYSVFDREEGFVVADPKEKEKSFDHRLANILPEETPL